MKNIFSSKHELISRTKKEILLNQNGICIWLTGLSGSGKTSIANHFSKKLHNEGIITQVIDGDNIRLGINKDLSFKLADRIENIRRVAEISKLFIECGIVTLCCFVSPTNNIRKQAKLIIGKLDFFEIYINTTLKECERRDTKGLYKKAREGKIKNFTGISSPFEPPKSPDLSISTENNNIEESVNILYNFAIPLIKKPI